MERRAISFVVTLLAASGCVGSIGDQGAPDSTPLNPGNPNDPTPPNLMEDPSPVSSGMCALAETSRVPRLTHEQYDNTVADLLFLQGTQPSTMLAPESEGSVDSRAAEGYRTAAESIAARWVSDSAAYDQVVRCTPSGDGTACAREVIVELGRRAFRRPLTSDEVARFEALFAMRGQLSVDGTFEDGMQILVEAFLQSPSFLMRVQRSTASDSGRTVLNHYDIASRLSYMLWNSMPDDTLLDAAEAGELGRASEIRMQAERLLGDPKARAMVRAFHRRYLGIVGPHSDRWYNAMRNTDSYPNWSSEALEPMRRESVLVADDVVFDTDGGFDELMTTRVGFVNRVTAPLYGLPASDFGDELERVELDAERAGLFTRTGFLTANAEYDRTSPILRGAFIQKDILCTGVGAPPAGADSTPLPTGGGLTTIRERTDAMTDDGRCRGCHHTLINPVGFAFEHFDAVGQWRETDNGAPVDSSGEAPIGESRQMFDGALGLAEAVADSTNAAECYAKHWVEFAYERFADEDSCVIETLGANLAQDDYSIRQLLVDLTQTDSFRLRNSENEVTP